MHAFIEYGIILSSLCFWIYIDRIKIFEKKIINSALIHAVICGLGHSIFIIYQPRIVFDSRNFTSNLTDAYKILPCVSFGYSFYDLYIGIKSKKLENILHGLLFSVGFIYYYLKNQPLISYYTMITEISSIFLNLRVYRKKWIDITFAASFFWFRLIIYPSIAYIYLTDPNNVEKHSFCFTSLSLTLLNVYWFYYIVKKALNPSKKIEEIKENSE
jgi:hypothetical protein